MIDQVVPPFEWHGQSAENINGEFRAASQRERTIQLRRLEGPLFGTSVAYVRLLVQKSICTGNSAAL